MNTIFDYQPINHTIPFLWMHGEDESVLRETVRAINKSGNGGLCVESRPHPDFLGPKWWEDMDVVIDECKRLGMKVWLLDDESFPTGYSAGRAAGSDYTARYLYERHLDVAGPLKGSSVLVSLPVTHRGSSDRDRVISVIAAKRIPGKNMDHSTYVNMTPVPVGDLIDLTAQITDGVVYWDVPDGLWRIFIITAHYGLGDTRRDKYINPLTAEGTRILIDTVYAPHYERYKADFGKTFMGFFSDEPQFGGGHGYHAKIGRALNLRLPWSDDVITLMSHTLGEDVIKYMPGLWCDIGEKTAKVRYAYMNAVTELYGRNFCTQIGDWCRAHGAQYMGHVIEENNAHARLGAGTGHYFRALWGQDYSGIDIVLNGLIPGIKGGSHAQSATDFEADDDFFYYMLAQMAVSLAHIDPKKNGRSMCEIFGAYGWQEGLREMKWLADFMLSHGINNFVPHAFSPKAFPDYDCPPHFYARGENPQFRLFGLLINHINRVSEIISGGKSIVKTAVLYHAEAEWASDEMVKTQEILKILTQNHIEADIIPTDLLLKCSAEAGALNVNGYEYKALFVPYSKYMPASTAKSLNTLAENGTRVYIQSALPELSCTEDTDMSELLKNCVVSQNYEIAARVEDLSYVTADAHDTELKLHPYRKDGRTYLLAFNESIHRSVNSVLNVRDTGYVYRYDPFDDRLYSVESNTESKITSFTAELPPYGFYVYLITDEVLECENNPAQCRNEVAIVNWKVSTATAKEYPKFTLSGIINGPGNLNSTDKLPHFSGTVRYEAEFHGSENRNWLIDLGEVGESTEVYINDVKVGTKITPPYAFGFGSEVRNGINTITIDVTNTLVYSQRDIFSAFHMVQSSGLVGPVRLFTDENSDKA